MKTNRMDLTMKISQVAQRGLSPEEKYECIVKPATCAAWADLESDQFRTATANPQKNRHANIRPFEHTRVKVSPSEPGGSDYINASWVGEGHYIAAQAPTPVTVEDFWKMAWEQDCSIIAMLTDIEPGKAEVYWPENVALPMKFGNLTVSIRTGQQSEHGDDELAHGILVRYFVLSDGHTERRLTHLQFVAWPDYGVPKKDDFENFLMAVERHDENPSQVRIVHCSAGVGRTGTYIAVDMARIKCREGRKVNFTNSVLSLRKERLRMVDTAAQFALAKQCVRDFKKHSATASVDL